MQFSNHAAIDPNSRFFVSIRGLYGFGPKTFYRRLTQIQDLRVKTTGAMGLLTEQALVRPVLSKQP
jgi:hypothetical protein